MTLKILLPSHLRRVARILPALQARHKAARQWRAEARAVQARCEAVLPTLWIPVPFDEHAFCAELGARRGRPIVLQPLPLRAMTGRGVLYGLVLRKPTYDLIFYEQNTNPAHQRQIIVHEVSHLIFDHPTETIDPADLPSLPREITEGTQIRHVHRRDGVWTKEEREAEQLASLILEHANTVQTTDQVWESELIAALTRLEPLCRENDNA